MSKMMNRHAKMATFEEWKRETTTTTMTGQTVESVEVTLSRHFQFLPMKVWSDFQQETHFTFHASFSISSTWNEIQHNFQLHY